MLLDSQNLFSENQTITTGAIACENIIKFGTGEVSYVPVAIQATSDFSNLTNLKVSVQTSQNENFESSTTLCETTLPKESLKTGAMFPIAYLPRGNKGYMRLVYTVEGSSETTGKITAGVTCGNDISWQDL